MKVILAITMVREAVVGGTKDVALESDSDNVVEVRESAVYNDRTIGVSVILSREICLAI